LKKIPLVILLIAFIFITYTYFNPSIRFIYPIKYEKDITQHIDNEKGFMEWWYFDGSITENLSFVLSFLARPQIQYVVLSLYDSESDYRKTYRFNIAALETKISSNKCQVEFGKNTIREENGNYIVNINTAEMLFNFRFVPVTEGFAFLAQSRGATFYPTIKIPRGKISGVLEYEDKKINFNGLSYYDHNYFKRDSYFKFLKNGWYWGRFFTEHYTVVVTQFFGNKLSSYIAVFNNNKLLKFIPQPQIICEEGEIKNMAQLPSEINLKFDGFLLSISNDKVFSKTANYARFVNKVVFKVSEPGKEIAENGYGLSELTYKTNRK